MIAHSCIRIKEHSLFMARREYWFAIFAKNNPPTEVADMDYIVDLPKKVVSPSESPPLPINTERSLIIF